MRKWHILLATILCLATLLAAVPLASAAGVDYGANLALSRPYTVTAPIMDSSLYRIQTTAFPDDGTKLTDGVIGPASWGWHGPWVGYLRQDRREVVVDLGDVQTIQKLDAWFLQDKSAGIRFPQQVTFAVSDNQVAWSTVGQAQTAISLSADGVLVQDYSVSGLNLTARYVRYTFYTDVWAFLSEVQAWGQQGQLAGATRPVPTPPVIQPPQGYPLAGSRAAGGKHHETLIYSGYYYNHPTVGKWLVDQLLPYVAYLDENHQIRDFMFDSFLFLPFGVAPSSDWNPWEVNYGIGGTTKSDWQFFADHIFQRDLNLGALDQAVARVKAALKDNNYKARVVIGIPIPGINSNWGDGLNFDPAAVGQEQSLANRLAAVRWYVDYIKARWNGAGYENLELNGFYWYAEAVRHDLTPNDEKLIQETSKIVHEAGPYTFDWIPFHQSEGFRNWSANGFDSALMQPNYAWGAGADRMEVNAQLARHYGLGIEMELDWPVLSDSDWGRAARDNYTAYLDAAHAYHYQNSFLAWYQGYNIFWAAEGSAVPAIRQVYDQTYRFIKGNYQPSYRPGPGDTGSVNLSPTDKLPIGGYARQPNPEKEANPDRE